MAMVEEEVPQATETEADNHTEVNNPMVDNNHTVEVAVDMEVNLQVPPGEPEEPNKMTIRLFSLEILVSMLQIETLQISSEKKD